MELEALSVDAGQSVVSLVKSSGPRPTVERFDILHTIAGFEPQRRIAWPQRSAEATVVYVSPDVSEATFDALQEGVDRLLPLAAGLEAAYISPVILSR
jgi:hypothetical protein